VLYTTEYAPGKEFNDRCATATVRIAGLATATSPETWPLLQGYGFRSRALGRQDRRQVTDRLVPLPDHDESRPKVARFDPRHRRFIAKAERGDTRIDKLVSVSCRVSCRSLPKIERTYDTNQRTNQHGAYQTNIEQRSIDTLLSDALIIPRTSFRRHTSIHLFNFLHELIQVSLPASRLKGKATAARKS
jgi:hypothetical protein